MSLKVAPEVCTNVVLALFLCLVLPLAAAAQDGVRGLPFEEDAPVPPPAPFKPQASLLRDQTPSKFKDGKPSRKGIAVVGNNTLLVCQLRKVASRVVSEMEARIDGEPDWHSGSLGGIGEYLKRKAAVQGEITEQNQPPSVVMVRNPVTRVLSGYLNKIHKREDIKSESFTYCRDESCPDRLNSFEEFIGAISHVDMSKVNAHFTPQHRQCGFDEGLKYDCIISYENRAAEWKECLTKLGLWDKYGASGWGPFGTQAFFEEIEPTFVYNSTMRSQTVTGDPDLFKKHYTPELLAAVFKMYKRDFELFGYSTDLSLYWGDSPEHSASSGFIFGLNSSKFSIVFVMGLSIFLFCHLSKLSQKILKITHSGPSRGKKHSDLSN